MIIFGGPCPLTDRALSFITTAFTRQIHDPAAVIITVVSQFVLRYLSQLLQLLADALIFRLQLVVLLLELLFLLQHRQPVLRRLDLLLRGLGQLPGQPLHLLLLLRGHL